MSILICSLLDFKLIFGHAEMMKKSSENLNIWLFLIAAAFVSSPLRAETSVVPLATQTPTEEGVPASQVKVDTDSNAVTQVSSADDEKKKTDVKNANLLVYFTHKDQDEVEELKPLIRPLSSKCAKCEISIVSIAFRGSAIDLKDLQKKVSDVPDNAKMVVFDFNLRDTADTQFWSQQLRKLQDKGVLIISSTGRALESDIPLFLNKTVLGQNQKIILIGELSEKERMWPLSHFGPEILTALKLPDQYSGQDLAGLYVALRILPKVQQKSMEDWVTQLSDKKFKTKKIWLDLDEI